jgi:asparagine synthetase B (glutamine-hydrolysing)
MLLPAAFVIYDGEQKRVLAARDASGAQGMHWGVTDDGRFMFGSDVDDLAGCNPTATAFPAGVYAPLLTCSCPMQLWDEACFTRQPLSGAQRSSLKLEA